MHIPTAELDCPQAYRNNCRNSPGRCGACVIEGGDELLYSPITRMPPHPYIIAERRAARQERAQDKQTRRRSQQGVNARSGRAVETQVLKQIKARPTVASGAVYGDGDGHITINGRLHYIEHKLRKAGSPGPTGREWATAEGRNIDIFIVSSPAGKLVTMPLSLFQELLCYST